MALLKWNFVFIQLICQESVFQSWRWQACIKWIYLPRSMGGAHLIWPHCTPTRPPLAPLPHFLPLGTSHLIWAGGETGSKVGGVYEKFQGQVGGSTKNFKGMQASSWETLNFGGGSTKILWMVEGCQKIDPREGVYEKKKTFQKFWLVPPPPILNDQSLRSTEWVLWKCSSSLKKVHFKCCTYYVSPPLVNLEQTKQVRTFSLNLFKTNFGTLTLGTVPKTIT